MSATAFKPDAGWELAKRVLQLCGIEHLPERTTEVNLKINCNEIPTIELKALVWDEERQLTETVKRFGVVEL